MLETIDGIMLVVWAAIALIFIFMEASRFYGDHFPFAVGALAGLLCWVLKLDVIVEVIAAVVVTIFSWFVLRPLFQKLMEKEEQSQYLDPEEWVGKQATVTMKVDINVYENNGRVRIGDHEVRARALDPNQKYNIGDKVTVVDVDKNCAVVKK
ncbi:MAG: NfeD family protein [Eggerthellales bacterium]|nr:NfeD family protein [Eggerthellales bacterium]